MVDDTLRRTLDRLVKSLELRFTLLAMGIPSLLEVVSQVHTHGQRISEELEAEIPRVREAYENIPWWQSVAPIEILGEGTQRRVFTSYHDFLSAKAMHIRERVEHAAIVYDHFMMLRGYFTWYTNGPPSVSLLFYIGRVWLLIGTGRCCEKKGGGAYSYGCEAPRSYGGPRISDELDRDR